MPETAILDLLRPRNDVEARTCNPDLITPVYVGTPLGAPTREGILLNYRRALAACEQLIREGYAPIAPHLIYPQVLEEMVPEDRELGVNLDMALLRLFPKVVLFTPDGTARTLTSGMVKDFDRAESCGIPVEFRVLPTVAADWSPSCLTAGGFWLRPALAAA